MTFTPEELDKMWHWCEKFPPVPLGTENEKPFWYPVSGKAKEAIEYLMATFAVNMENIFFNEEGTHIIKRKIPIFNTFKR